MGISIYTVGVHPLFALGVQTAFAGRENVSFCGQFASVDELPALDSSETLESHIALVSYDAIRLRDGIVGGDPVLPHKENYRMLLLLRNSEEQEHVMRALHVCADGYLLSSVDPDTLVQAIYSLARGFVYIDSRVTSTVLEQLRRPSLAPLDTDVEVVLNSRERMLLQYATDGLSNVDIADALGIKENTIRKTWSNLFDKLRLGDRTQVVLWAIRTGNAELR